jgi:hypothetical protein
MAHLPPAAAAGDWHRLFDNTTAALATMDQLRQPEAAAALLMQKAEALQGVGDTHAAVQVRQDGADQNFGSAVCVSKLQTASHLAIA